MLNGLSEQLATMSPISLKEIKGVKLMNRVDTKYIANAQLLMEFLSNASVLYYIQEVSHSRLSTYDTMYYDTPQLEMYLKHHNRKLNRQKIRIRTYTDSDISFLEVKNKTNKGRTIKQRITIDPTTTSFNNDVIIRNFLESQSNYKPTDLQPQVRTQFNRITLVNKDLTERLTIDLNLKFENKATDIHADLKQVMIIELKQNSAFPSPTKLILREMRIKPTKISKYCIGTVLTNDHAKRNRFKQKIRLIDKIDHEKNF